MWHARIGTVLAESGAADDERVLAAARRLLALADPEKAKTFNINILQPGHTSPPAPPAVQ